MHRNKVLRTWVPPLFEVSLRSECCRRLARLTILVLSPGERVLAITELKESILLKLDFDDLLLCRKVSSGCRKSIDSNKTLRQRLFFDPDPLLASQDLKLMRDMPEYANGIFVINPIVLRGLRRKYICASPDGRELHLIEKKFTRLEARMLFSHPPLRDLDLRQKVCCKNFTRLEPRMPFSQPPSHDFELRRQVCGHDRCSCREFKRDSSGYLRIASLGVGVPCMLDNLHLIKPRINCLEFAPDDLPYCESIGSLHDDLLDLCSLQEQSEPGDELVLEDIEFRWADLTEMKAFYPDLANA